MKLDLIARRYSEAFVDYSKQTLGLEKAIEEIKALKKIMRGNPEFLMILTSPAVTINEKFEFIDTVLRNCFSNELSQFLKLIVEKNRTSILNRIIEYLVVNYSQGEAKEVLVRSAYPLEPEMLQKVKERLENKLQKNLHFSVILDKALLGGLQVEIGNTIIDASLKGRLGKLKDELKTARKV